MGTNLDSAYMALAIKEAQAAAKIGEVPVGAVIVRDGEVISKAHNLRESSNDPTAHAELLALRIASAALGTWRLSGCELYVTLEPCIMCAGAMVLARIDRLVFGASDPKAGAAKTLFNVLSDPRLNHQVDVTAGVKEATCGQMLSDFFKSRRK